MSAADAIRAARAAGVNIGIEGDNLVLDIDDDIPEHVIEAIAQHKREVLALLRAEAQPADKGLLFYSCRFCGGEGAGCSHCQGTGAKACPRCLGQGLDCAPCRGTGRMVIETDFDREAEGAAESQGRPAPAIDADATEILRRHAKRLGLAPESVAVLAGGHYAPARPPIALPPHIALARARLYEAARLMGLSAWRVHIEMPAARDQGGQS